MATPFAVMIAYPAHNWSRATPFAFAFGITFPIADDNSETVVFPRFCVWTSMSETSVTFSASSPYALRIVVRMSSVSPDSANPAVASFVDSLTKFTASAVSCPALMALYTLSAMSPAAIPVSFDRPMIASSISSTDITPSSMMVDTLALASSKSTAIFADAVANVASPAETTVILFPNCSIFCPALSQASANTLSLWFFNSLFTSSSSASISMRAVSALFALTVCLERAVSVLPIAVSFSLNSCSTLSSASFSSFVASEFSPVAFFSSSYAFFAASTFALSSSCFVFCFPNCSVRRSCCSLFICTMFFCTVTFCVRDSAFALSASVAEPNSFARVAAREYSLDSSFICAAADFICVR
ncbi:hypothetical protein IMSAGC019_01089 [Lachnospiraceae bacterium]|nr:hypothetical protein IMSAGC019_01089 [Lachnospiraceae bacterium]